MADTRYAATVAAQRAFFLTGTTLPVEYRIAQLQQLRALIEKNEAAITQALYQDLHKAPAESIANEIVLVYKEITFMCKHLKQWVTPQKVPTPFFLIPGRSRIHNDPYGCTLIVGPWNYPFLLMILPLVGAMAAGNCALLKPSEIAAHTQALLVDLINSHFPANYVHAIEGGPDEMQALLALKFDYLFFTGGTQIGKIMMQAAAQHLTPVTLELGGKSPCIVDPTADLDAAARRIMWAKTTNAGQVCIAPDFLYVHASCKEALIEKFKRHLYHFYGDDPLKSNSYGRIINPKHFERLQKLMQHGRIRLGGHTDASHLYIAPTVIDEITWEDPIMQEEIFGPILPIITYEHIDEVIATLKSKAKPLALYVFSQSRDTQDTLLTQLSYGGGCVNDCILQIVNPSLPFGGVGASGIGAYHGRYSFDTFSHRKGIYYRMLNFDSRLQYPPYTEKKLYWLRRLMGQ